MPKDVGSTPPLLTRNCMIKDNKEQFRRDFAAQALLVMLDFPGDRSDKVRAAVQYAIALVEELDRTEVVAQR